VCSSDLINVFIAPVAGADSAPHARSENGFHTLRWTQGGMRFWAVSDVDAEQLARLSGFLRETGDAK
jgi:anti-sigma factor RsiW